MKIMRLIYKAIVVGHMRFMSIIYKWITLVLLKFNEVKIGKGLRVYRGIPAFQISRKSGNVVFGKRLTLNNYETQSWYCKCKFYVKENAELTIGDNTGLNGVMIFCADRIKIGNYVNIGGGTRIYDSNFHNLDWQKRRCSETNTQAKTSPVIIEDDVFIGANCMIGKGVTIGARSIIAAGSVVIKSIPADCIAGGNPCKVVKNITTK